MTNAADGKPPRHPAGALGRGLLLVVVDAFVLNQGILAALVGLWVTFVSLPRVLFSKRWAGRRRTGLLNTGIYLAAVGVVLVLIAQFNGIARERAVQVVAAVEAYHADTGAWPPALAALVPRYLPAVPPVKPTLAFNRFIYLPGGPAPRLMYVEMPPFGRPWYDFGDGTWGYAD